MPYILTIDFPDAGEHEEEYADVGYALARVKELQAMPWAQGGTPSMTLVDSAGAEIDIDTGLYVVNVNRRVPDPVKDAIKEDAARRLNLDPRFSISSRPVNPTYKGGRFVFPELKASELTADRLPDAWKGISAAVLTPEQCRAADSSETILVNANWLGELLAQRESPDANVEAVREAMLQRSEFGLRKYGITTANSPLGMAGWLQHLQEELMDATVYVQCLKNVTEAGKENLRVLIADAYEQGYEQCANDGAADYPMRNEDKDEYVNRVLAEQVKEK